MAEPMENDAAADQPISENGAQVAAPPKMTDQALRDLGLDVVKPSGKGFIIGMPGNATSESMARGPRGVGNSSKTRRDYR